MQKAAAAQFAPTSVARVPTPHLDQLRAEGAVFNRAYTASSMCAPSRYSLLTGRYPSRCIYGQARTTDCASTNTVSDVNVPNSKLDDETSSNLASSLKQLNVGYMTGIVGKWHVSVEAGTGTTNWLPTNTMYPANQQLAKNTGFVSSRIFFKMANKNINEQDQNIGICECVNVCFLILD